MARPQFRGEQQMEGVMPKSPISKLLCFGGAKLLTLGGEVNLIPEDDFSPRP